MKNKIVTIVSVIIISLIGVILYLNFFHLQEASNSNELQNSNNSGHNSNITAANKATANTSVTNTNFEKNVNVLVDQTRLFKSAHLGYSVIIPQGWFTSSLSDIYGASLPEQDYIKNQKVEGPSDMNKNGIWISISRNSRTGKAFNAFIVDDIKNSNLTEKIDFVINGYRAEKYKIDPKPEFPTESGYDWIVYIDTPQFFYKFAILALTKVAYEQNQSRINSIISSFSLK